MKKLSKIVIITVLSVFLVAGSAMAIPWGPPGAPLQGVLDNITKAPILGDSSVDVTTDYMSDTADSYWSITGSGGSISTMIIELTTFAPDNIFGVYSGGNYVPLFEGAAAAEPNKNQTSLSIWGDGSVLVKFVDTGVDFAGNNFGFYLDSTANTGGGLWHSDTSLNDGEDHMFAYQGTNTDMIQIPPFGAGLWSNNEYVLAFEDLDASAAADWDYTDMVVIVESVRPVPEPTTMLLLGSGLIGLAGFGRKKLLFKKG